MARKLKNASKKTVILMTILVVVLLVAAVTGTVAFLKNRGSAEATDLDTQQVEREIGTEGTNSENGETPEQPEGQQTEIQNGEQGANAGQANADQANAGANNQNANQGQTATAGQNAQGANAGTTTDNIQEATITRAETVEIPEQQISEGHYVGWSPMSIQAEAASAKMNAKYEHIVVTKTITNTPADGKAYKLGEIIEFTVTVLNDGNTVIDSMKVEDQLDGATLVDGENDEIKSLEPGNTAEVKYTYAVQEKDIGNKNFTNTAVVKINDEEKGKDETPEIPVEEPFIKLELVKTATNKDKEYGLDEVINYTIAVTNNGNQTATDVKVTDANADKEEGEEIATRTIESIAPGATEEVGFTHKVTENDIKAGKVVNVATIETTPSNEEETKTEDPVIKYTLVKKAETKPEGYKYKLGEVIKYTVDVTNNGNQTATDVKVTDANADKAEGEEIATRTVESIVPGETKTVSFTHKVTEADIAKKEVVNVATIGTTPSNEEKTETEDPVINYTLVKKAETKQEGYKYKLGEVIKYTVAVTNNGNQTATDVKVTDANADKAEGEEIATRTIESIAPGETKTVSFTHKVTENDIKAGEVVNVATIGTTPSNEEKTETEDPVINYTLVKKAETKPEGYKYKLGEVIKYTVDVTNNGNQTATDVKVTDANADKAEGEEIATRTIEAIAPGKTEKVYFTHKVTENDIKAGEVVNVATIGTTPSNEEKTETEDPVINYTLVKKAETKPEGYKYKLGEVIKYTVDVTNNGNQTATDVKVTDANADKAEGEEIATRTIEAIAPGKTKTVSFTHKVTENDIKAGKVVNVATIGTTPSNEEKTETEDPVINYILVKKAETKPEGYKYKLGEVIKYTVDVTNNGNQTATDVKVTDANADKTEGEKIATRTIESIAPGETKTVSFTHKVTENDIKAGEVVNVATIGTTPSNEEKTETEDPVINYTLVKKAETKPEGYKYKLGEVIKYTVDVTNNGNQTATDVKVTDANADKTEGEEIATRTIESIAPGETKTVSFTHKVTENDIKAGEVVNVATIGTTPSNEEKTETEDPVINYTLVKKAETKPEGYKYKLGEVIKYTVDVTNNGNQTATDVKVTDANADKAEGEEIATRTIEAIAPGKTEKVYFTHKVTENDIKAGKVVNVATIGTTPSNEEETKTEDPVINYTLVKKAETKPEGYKYKLGEVIKYTVDVTNNGNQTATDVKVTDANADKAEGEEIATRTIEAIAPGKTEKVYFTHKVTENDIKAGKVVNVATIGTTPSNEEETKTEDPDINCTLVKTATHIISVDENNTEKETKITRNEDVKDKNGKDNITNNIMNVGNIIRYNIIAKNIGNTTLNNVVISDNHDVKVTNIKKNDTELNFRENANTQVSANENLLNVLPLNEGETSYTLIPDEEYIITVEYTVENVNLESIDNTAKIIADNISEKTDSETVPVTQITISDIVKKSVSYGTIGTENLITNENRENIKLIKGNKVRYEITVENKGNTILNNVKVTDSRNDVKVIKIESVDKDGRRVQDNTLKNNSSKENILGKNVLLQGEKYIITLEYTENGIIDEKDTTNGAKVINTATLTYDNGNKTSTDTLNKKEEIKITKTKTSKVYHNGNVIDGNKVNIGDIIKYTITVTNDGNKTGTSTIKDSKLKENIKNELVTMNGKIVLKKGNTVQNDNVSFEKLTSEGIVLTVAPNETYTIEFEVKVGELLPGVKIENVLDDAKTNDEKTQSDVEANITVTKKIVEPQNVVLVIDLSLSMAQAVKDENAVPSTESDPMANSYENTRWAALESALDDFLKVYMGNNNPNGNTVTIIGYNTTATKVWGPTTSYAVATGSTGYKSVLSKTTFENIRKQEIKNGDQSDVDHLQGTENKRDHGEYADTGTLLRSGTNIDAALQQTKITLGNKVNNAKVVIMTDGQVNKCGIDGKGKGDYEAAAKKSATTLKNAGATLYSVGFVDGSETFLRDLASSSDKSIKIPNKDNITLKDWFKSTAETITDETKNGITTDGILILDSKFKIDTSKVTGVVVTIPTTSGDKKIPTMNWTQFSKYYKESDPKHSNKTTIDIYNLAKDNGIKGITGNVTISINVK